MDEKTPVPQNYAALLASIKERIKTAQVRAALAVNQELVMLYWNIGKEILARQGEEGWGRGIIPRLAKDLKGFVHHELDIRDRAGVFALVKSVKPSVIVHTAAQPSHDRAAAIPFDDFDTNAVGTLNLLEAARQACPESPFVHMSTNKVYGDAPNSIALKELETRWDYADLAYEHGIPESFTIDQSKHSL